MPQDIQKLKDKNAFIEEALNDAVREQLMSMAGVVHVSIGLKEKGTRLTDDLCIRVYVKEKIAAKVLDKADIIPEKINGIPTDVNVVETINFEQDNARYQELIGGITVTNRIIGFNSTGTGTLMSRGSLGCMATYTQTNSIVILSNWHVLAANGAVIGDRIYQPSPTTLPVLTPAQIPFKPKDDTDAIGKLLKHAITTKVDGAIASLDGCNSICSRCCGRNYKNEINGLSVGGNPPKNTIIGEASATIGETVYKVGRSTGRTVGRVVDDNFPTFSITRGGTTYTFSGQIKIQQTTTTIPFSQHGDSGSVIINHQNKIIGLLFASGRSTVGTSPSTYSSIANHIADVKSALGITINLSPATTSTSGTMQAVAVNSTVGTEEEQQWLSLKTKLLAHSGGAHLYKLFEKHQNEIIYLVNHRREVTVRWRSNKGPAFLAAVLSVVNEEKGEIPKTINGIKLLELLTNMATVLQIYGSEALQLDLTKYAKILLSQIEQSNTIDQMMNSTLQEKFEHHELEKIANP